MDDIRLPSVPEVQAIKDVKRKLRDRISAAMDKRNRAQADGSCDGPSSMPRA